MDIVQILIDKGMTPADARLITDLATHANEKGLETIVRVVDSAPEHIRSETLMLASMMLKAHLTGFVEQAIDLFQRYHKGEL